MYLLKIGITKLDAALWIGQEAVPWKRPVRSAEDGPPLVRRGIDRRRVELMTRENPTADDGPR